jgi:hypothetical protein
MNPLAKDVGRNLQNGFCLKMKKFFALPFIYVISKTRNQNNVHCSKYSDVLEKCFSSRAGSDPGQRPNFRLGLLLNKPKAQARPGLYFGLDLHA